jgi:hypothetical protein
MNCSYNVLLRNMLTLNVNINFLEHINNIKLAVLYPKQDRYAN